jgi:hypothetical protein
MTTRKNCLFSNAPGLVLRFLALLAIICAALPFTAASAAETTPPPKTSYPFESGERLTYNLSWSNIITAGTAVMEVRKEQKPGYGEVFRFTSTARSVGVVDTFYPVRDRIESVFDPRAEASLSYTLDQSHGKRKKRREYIFDQVGHKVAFTENGIKAIFDAPPQVQDALSSLYYVRISDELIPGRRITVHVFDGGKNWSVEIYVLAKEKIKTPAGTFDTIKVRTYPKYEGIFMHTGEIYIWFTDDARRIPVLMKSTITIGSIMATLTKLETGGEAR